MTSIPYNLKKQLQCRDYPWTLCVSENLVDLLYFIYQNLQVQLCTKITTRMTGGLEEGLSDCTAVSARSLPGAEPCHRVHARSLSLVCASCLMAQGQNPRSLSAWRAPGGTGLGFCWTLLLLSDEIASLEAKPNQSTWVDPQISYETIFPGTRMLLVHNSCTSSATRLSE